MEIGRKSYIKYTFSNGKSIYLSEKEEKELEDHYEEMLTPIIREQARKDYAPQMGHIALAAAIGFSRKRYIEAGDIKKEVPVDDDDEDFLDTVSDDSEDFTEEDSFDSDEWDDDDDDWVSDPEEGDR